MIMVISRLKYQRSKNYRKIDWNKKTVQNSFCFKGLCTFELLCADNLVTTTFFFFHTSNYIYFYVIMN